MQVVAISRPEAIAVLEDGTTAHFSRMFDIHGEETVDALEAASAVVPLPGGKWTAIDLTEFEPATRH